LNVWIATEDVQGYPLAFVRSDSVNQDRVNFYRTNRDTALAYDDQHRYTFVRNMKKGEMLVFKGTHVFHGSPTLVNAEHQGRRKSLSIPISYGNEEYDSW
jgi:hypothetical protein